ncbi:unnamed protein product [Adineta steineri]|uniref:Kinesin light chain n=1 Tax=Adineta steineri TaxID=433720 RepID=A0A814CDE2_9BILA|nr:unnamed protein product [Adineta steineri]CAF3931101.1 unnamed protein product [Adineta steineri]
MGRFDLAKLYFDELTKQLPPSDPRIADCFDGLGHIADDQGEYKEALDEYEKALSIRNRLKIKSDNEDIAISYINIANAYNNLQAYDEATENLKQAMDLIKDDGSSDDILVACYISIGSIQTMKGNYVEAEQQFNKALKIAERLKTFDDSDLGILHQNFGRLYFHQGKFEDSLCHSEKALEIRCEVLPDNHPSIGKTYQTIAAAQEKLKNYEEALEAYEKARDIYKARNVNPVDLITTERAISKMLNTLASKTERGSEAVNREDQNLRSTSTSDDIADQDEPDNEWRIILLGRSGVGKDSSDWKQSICYPK